MGRHPEIWKLIWPNGYGIVRFTHDGTRHTISTGQRDPARAREEAAKIYADVIGGKLSKKQRVGKLRTRQPLEDIFAEWLASLEGVLDERTINTYRQTYVPTHYVPFFKRFDNVDESTIDAYGRARLRKVLKKTLHKELGALRQFLLWCKMENLIEAVPPFPEYPHTVKGVRSGKQREKANILSEQQVIAAIRRMPEMSGRMSSTTRYRFVVQPRFIVNYETGLRPEALSSLRLGLHWKPGTSVLHITDDIDKARFARDLPITEVARDALARAVELQPWLRDGDPIFGHHDYRTYLGAAGLDEEVGVRLASYDFRHSIATHMLEHGATLGGIGFNHGHTQASTTSKYAHVSKKAGEQAIRAGRADLSGSIPDREDPK